MDLFSFNSNQFIEEYCNNFRYNFIDIESRLYDWTTYLHTVVTVWENIGDFGTAKCRDVCSV